MTDMLFDWRYCRLVRVVDGDTFIATINRGGDKETVEWAIRLRGINAPEKTGPTKALGLEAMGFAIGLLTKPMPDVEVPDWPLRIVTYKKDDFGRWIADVYLPWDKEKTMSMMMVEAGMAVYKDYR